MGKNNHYQRALARAQHLCAAREYCEADISDKLKNYALSSDDMGEILKELREQGFLNHSRYAKAFAHDKYKFNAWGKLKIRAHLLARNIDEVDIKEALAHIPDEEYKAVIFHELGNKWQKLDDADPYQKKGKLFRFAQSRGYEFEWVQRFLDDKGNGE